MEGVVCPRQAPVDLDTYRSSYMVDYKHHGKHKCSSITPEEQAKVEKQLREKEFYKLIPNPNPKLEDGYPAFRRPYMNARDLGQPSFFPPRDRARPEEPTCRLTSICPSVYSAPQAQYQGLWSAGFPCLLEPERQPAPEEGRGYFLLPGCLCPHCYVLKVPVLSRWGPLLPFY